MRQSRHQCLFSVISFHAGVYLSKYYPEMNIFKTAYYYMTLNLDMINWVMKKEIVLKCFNL